MTLEIKKAMLFAAGRGERLRPLTDRTPKPLLPIGDKPLIDYSLSYLKRYGIEEVVINLWHLGKKIERHVGDGKKFGLRIFYSKEKELLGTGGGLKNAEKYFENEKAFITLNSDTLINCDLKELEEFHAAQQNPATLVVTKWQEGYTRFNVDGKDYLFTGLAVLSPVIFKNLTLKTTNLITQGVISNFSAFVHEDFWQDIGTPQNYKAAQEEWASAHGPRIS